MGTMHAIFCGRTPLHLNSGGTADPSQDLQYRSIYLLITSPFIDNSAGHIAGWMSLNSSRADASTSRMPCLCLVVTTTKLQTDVPSKPQILLSLAVFVRVLPSSALTKEEHKNKKRKEMEGVSAHSRKHCIHARYTASNLAIVAAHGTQELHKISTTSSPNTCTRQPSNNIILLQRPHTPEGLTQGILSGLHALDTTYSAKPDPSLHSLDRQNCWQTQHLTCALLMRQKRTRPEGPMISCKRRKLPSQMREDQQCAQRSNQASNLTNVTCLSTNTCSISFISAQYANYLTWYLHTIPEDCRQRTAEPPINATLTCHAAWKDMQNTLSAS